MQEIVTKVLEAEKAAEQRLQEARTRAAEIRAQADRDVQAKLEEARKQATLRSQEILEKARDRAKAEHDQAIQQAHDEDRDFFQTHEEQINRAAEAVVDLVISPEWS
jgi:V/A-type H+-transporting ATPase subunit G/H